MVAAHSTEGGGLRPAARLVEVLLVALLAGAPAIVAHATPVGASPSSVHWTHVERRIESGYFQQDAAGLTGVAATLSPAVGADGNAGDVEPTGWRCSPGAMRRERGLSRSSASIG
jgi:hypothetical protein